MASGRHADDFRPGAMRPGWRGEIERSRTRDDGRNGSREHDRDETPNDPSHVPGTPFGHAPPLSRTPGAWRAWYLLHKRCQIDAPHPCRSATNRPVLLYRPIREIIDG